MTESESLARTRALANKRRQAYWMRRRRVEALGGKDLLPDLQRMTNAQVWRELHDNLRSLVDRLEGGSSPEMYAWAVKADQVAWEAYSRGAQMMLFPASDLVSGGEAS